jgi:ornithine cyclodeaminase
MPRITILTEAELRRIVPLDLDAVARIEQAFVALATEAVVMPPVLRLDIPQHHGEVDVKTAFVPGLDNFAIKVSPGFFDNPKIGLPSVNGLMVLLSARTGLVEALLLDNGYLTDVRTAAAGAVAAKHLARPDARVATVFGAGVQARLQLMALMLVRPIREARIWARRHDRAEALASQLRTELGIEVQAEQRPERAVAGADVIVTMGHSVGSVELPEGVKHQDWRVGDPVGATLDEVRRVRDDIERRVRALLAELQVLPGDEPDAEAEPSPDAPDSES